MGNKNRLCALFLMLILATSGLQALGEETLTIYYTSSLNGNLDGCDCKGQPRSGLVKTGYYLNERDKEASILLDAGDFLDVKQDKLLAEYILESYEELDYTVIGVGDQEFSNGIEALKTYGEDYPLLCNNLSIKKAEHYELYSPLPRIIERRGIRIGVFAVIDPDVFFFYPDEIVDNITVESPVDAAADLVAEMEDYRVDIIVGIYHGPLEGAESLAKDVDGIDVLLAGHEQRLLDAKVVEDTVIVSPGENGNRVGVLELSLKRNRIQSFENSFKHFDYKAAPDLPSVRKRIHEYYKQLTGRLRDGGEE